MKKSVLLLLLFLPSVLLYSQKNASETINEEDIRNSVREFINDLGNNRNPRSLKPFVVSAGLDLDLDDENGNITSTFGYFITPQVEAEMTLGSNMSDRLYFASGARLHLCSRKSSSWVTPFTGVLFGTDYGTAFAQIPIGFNMATRFGLNISLSLNSHMWFSSYNFYSANIRLGWRFR